LLTEKPSQLLANSDVEASVTPQTEVSATLAAALATMGGEGDGGTMGKIATWAAVAGLVGSAIVGGTTGAAAEPDRAPAAATGAAGSEVPTAGAEVPGTGSARPRILFAPDQRAELEQRLEREPYRSLFVALHQRTVVYDTSHALGDPAIVAQRDLARAAKNLAFEYALDRTVVDGTVVAFPDAAARAATGDRVRQLLLQLYDRSRMAVPAPIGGWDRDINTSEEIVDYATAFDTLLGAGYPLGADEAVIADRLGRLVSEQYTNYVRPETAGNAAALMQNNHRSKVGAALAIAAIVLGGWEPPASAGPGASRPIDWFDYGVREVDDVLRHMLMAGDGAYGEGPYYYRYTAMNLLPYARAWERHIGPGTYRAGDVVVPSPWRQPQFARTQRWMLDTTVPDGGMAPIDDGNPNRSYYFGVLPSFLPEIAAYYWRWAEAPQPFDTDGAVDLGADAIVAYDDAVEPAPPTWSPTRFYAEGGTATFRSGWDDQAVMALALGEHDTASEFGRDRTGAARGPQSHEHADPGAFLLHAYGERLALDPGYLTFTTHGQVNQPQHHNTVLVDGQGPPDYLVASLGWLSRPAGARPPAEGQSTLARTVDGDGLDAATVVSQYRGTDLDRRFLFLDDGYLVVADRVASTAGPGAGDHDLTWMLHGNGGGTSGGSFEPTSSGGRWTIGGARLDSAIDVTGAVPPELTTTDFVHERRYQEAVTHTAVRATTRADATQAVQVLYPTRSGAGPPTVTSVDADGTAAVSVVDEPADRHVVAARTPTGPTSLTGSRAAATDGTVLVTDAHLDGRLRLAWADRATSLSYGGTEVLTAPTARSLGLRLGDGTADVVAMPAAELPSPAGPSTVTVRGLPFTPRAVDGACGLTVRNGKVEVRVTRDSPATLRSTRGNGRPAADAGNDRRVARGSTVTLDGRASCDPDGDRLTPRWELVSAPAGSAWSLTGADSWQPQLQADRVGPYRARLTVTDRRGDVSTEAEVLVVAGGACNDGVDGDLDGRIDTDDPDCDGPEDGVIVAVDPGQPFRAGLAPAPSFTVDRDAAGALTGVAGTATVDPRGTTLTVDATRRRDGRWTGHVELQDDALGPRPLRVDASRAHLREVAPGILYGELRTRAHTHPFLVLDH
jgi:hypothetical protein